MSPLFQLADSQFFCNFTWKKKTGFLACSYKDRNPVTQYRALNLGLNYLQKLQWLAISHGGMSFLKRIMAPTPFNSSVFSTKTAITNSNLSTKTTKEILLPFFGNCLKSVQKWRPAHFRYSSKSEAGHIAQA